MRSIFCHKRQRLKKILIFYSILHNKLKPKICALLSCYLVLSDTYLPTFREILSVTSSESWFLLYAVKYAVFTIKHFSLKVQFRQSNRYENITFLTINFASQPVLFADDTSVIITGRNLEDFCSVSNADRSQMIVFPLII